MQRYSNDFAAMFRSLGKGSPVMPKDLIKNVAECNAFDTCNISVLYVSVGII